MTKPATRSKLFAALSALAAVVLLGFVAFRATHSNRVPEPAPQTPATAAPSSSAGEVKEPVPAAIEPVSSSEIVPGVPSAGLPATAPDSVSFGVVLVAYRGAEKAPDGARSKADAKKRVAELLGVAQSNFEDAVKLGDHGSVADAGTIPRGVLEPSVEYVLFTLQKGQVYGEPIDTPRGYWIIRRNQ